ncbi:probable methyltransferase-like protein 24 isoform X2 [Octopus bimaculoides]|uniref:Methyltransferase domain-containing protein n=1 Tax=Octopus bimaculoides TaxID=37653 RepID=A0A0L8IEJ8_OCTBM|nr:probable methyltransferase-like protein 24 isoform X2 [Octopus bimaculoides]|eukprot:XP_014775435.1 PREDICTED: methyltransferase-like protein 24 isoform X2 [Octopus bimaculoides]
MIENRKKVYILITGGFFVYLIIYWKYFESSSILPSTEYLDAKSASDLEELYHGIGLDSSFDVEMKILYGCEVHSFDPFVPKSQIPYLLSLNYHAIGISGETGIVNGTQFMTLLDIRKHLNHTEKNISILKMDVENDEWNSLIKAMYDGELDHVKQLLVEFHSHFSAASKWNVHRNALNVVKKLMDFNFRIFSIGKNKACLYISDRDILLTKCYNVHMVKVS